MNIRSYLVVCFLLATVNTEAAVWTANRQWTEDDEIAFSRWVDTELDTAIFTSAASKYYGLRTDCADFVYTARAIYAFENKLPFAVNDPTNSSNTINNNKTSWDRDSSEIGRFFAFNNYFHQMLSTSTVHKDTYPVALNRDVVVPGGIFLFYKYHAMLLKRLETSGLPIFVESTVPREARNLYVRFGIPAAQFDKMDNPGGLRKFKSPQSIKKSEWQFPGYSLEQYELRLSYDTAASWAREVHTRLALGNHAETSQAEMTRHFKTVCDMTKERVNIVQEGVRYRQRVSRPLNASEYDNYSTPSRDQKIKEYFANFIEANNRARASNTSIQSAQVILQNANNCPIVFDGSSTISLWTFYSNMMSGRVSSNPNDSLMARWGF